MPTVSQLIQQQKKLKRLQTRVNPLHERVRQRNRKIRNLKDLLNSLKEKTKLGNEKIDCLQKNFGCIAKKLFQNQEFNATVEKVVAHWYNNETKQFAMTLHYYSPKVYKFVCKVLKLPHVSSIHIWASSVDCQPGYLTQVIALLEEMAQKNQWMRDAVLVVDAMSLSKMTVYDRTSKSFVGLVDYGTTIPEPEATEATEALVFMVVGTIGHWKQPIAYVLQNKCSAEVQKQLILDCIGLLHEQSIDVLAIVFDGTYTNQLTARKLGCKMMVAEMKTWFAHPQKPSRKVHVVFDICHMIKLMRNLLGDYQTISHNANGEVSLIKLEFIDKLNNLQENLGLSLANRLKKKHVVWEKQKMSVRLAAQTLSASIAAAIDFLREDLLESDFQGSESTTEFIKKIDTIFDMMNSRHPFAQGSKQPVTLANYEQWARECERLAEYIFALKDEHGCFLRNSRHKTVIWCFPLSIRAVSAVAEELLKRKSEPYKFVLTYKFSQDHLELLFNKIRQRGGWNNNPNVHAFKMALRRILI